jgi:hypothetical protein
MILECMTHVTTGVEQCTPARPAPQTKTTTILQSGEFPALDTSVRVEASLNVRIFVDNPAPAANLHSRRVAPLNAFPTYCQTVRFGFKGAFRIAAFLRSYGWLLIVTAIVAVFQSLYVIAGATPSMYAQLIASCTLPICFATWVQTDARIRRCTPFFDFGTFVLVIWTLAIPWYLIWTRGWRGLLVTLMFFGLWVLPAFVASFVWIVSAIMTRELD